MADSEDVQWQLVLYEDWVASRRTPRLYYFSEPEALFEELQPVFDVSPRVVVWDDQPRAPLRAAICYYFGAPSASQDETDGQYDQVISAYTDWRAVPSLLQLYWRGWEENSSVAEEPQADPSEPAIGKAYRSDRHRINRSWYAGTAQDESGPEIESQNPSLVVGMRYTADRFRTLPFHRFIQYGDEGVVIVEVCAPRRGAGAPTVAGLARATTDASCAPRAGAGPEVCAER